MKDKRNQVLFRCDGSSTIGIGHVMRCLALADELRDEHHIDSGFALRSDHSGARLIERKDYPVFITESGQLFDYRGWLNELTHTTSAEALVLDVRDDLPISALEDLRQSNILLVDIDDSSRRRLHADLVFYPPVPQVDRLDWEGFEGALYVGWDWIPLRREIARAPVRAQSVQLQNLLLTTGGADPAGMAPRIVQLLGCIEKPLDTVVVAGPAFQHRIELERAIAATSGNYRIENDPDNLPQLMAEADLAITSFGVTAYELAALGVPAIYFCLTPDHEESALALARAGAGISLGLFSGITAEKLCQGMAPLLESSDLRNRMSVDGRNTVDGRGAGRISQLIAQHIGSGLKDD